MVLAGCSGDESPKVSPGASNSPKPAESVKRLDAPYERSLAYTKQLNARRNETFNQEMPGVLHSNVVYTAAYRHSVYLNSINCANYQPNGATGVSVGVPTTTVTGDTPYATWRVETAPSGTGIFPALYTNNTAYARVAAVVGSPDLLSGSSPSDINDFFVFNGNITTTTTGTVGELRGFNRDTRTNADPTKYVFTPVDDIWYSSRGRTALMRASLKAWAYASAYDGSSITPPWPVVDQRFLGTVTTITPAQKVAMFGFWPSRDNQDVCPYGLDTDVTAVGGVDNVRHDYSGPPIHITLPVAEPFLMNANNFAGGIKVSFRKVGGIPTDGVTQLEPNLSIIRNVILRTRQTGVFQVIYRGGLTTGGQTTPGPYDYDFLTSTPTFDPGDELRNGELIMVPTEPLEPNSWYEVGVRLRTASYILPVPKPGTPNDENEIFTWRFKTNDKTPY